MKIIYTCHARKRMSQRRVTPEQVEETLAWPDDTLLGEQDEEIVTRQFSTREVRVVYHKDVDRGAVVVYTVISKRLKRRRKGQ